MDYWGDEAKAKLICRMEQIIAKHCSSKNYSMTHYRYPVHYRKKGVSYRSKGSGYVNLDCNEIPSMHYEFGSHRMDIGDALLEIVEFLSEHGTLEDFYEDEPEKY